MPIEIKELHIRVAVNAPSGGPAAGSRTSPAAGKVPADDVTRDAIVAESVEQVLRILREKKER